MLHMHASRDGNIAVQTGMEALKPGGTYVLVGMGAEACDCFPSLTLVTKEADVKGCFRYTNTVSTPVPSDPGKTLGFLLSGHVSLVPAPIATAAVTPSVSKNVAPSILGAHTATAPPACPACKAEQSELTCSTPWRLRCCKRAGLT